MATTADIQSDLKLAENKQVIRIYLKISAIFLALLETNDLKRDENCHSLIGDDSQHPKWVNKPVDQVDLKTRDYNSFGKNIPKIHFCLYFLGFAGNECNWRKTKTVTH